MAVILEFLVLWRICWVEGVDGGDRIGLFLFMIGRVFRFNKCMRWLLGFNFYLELSPSIMVMARKRERNWNSSREAELPRG